MGRKMNALELEPFDPDAICPVRRTPFDDLADMQLRSTADMVLTELSTRERDIIERHLGLFNDKDSTLVAIAKDLKVTPTRVRQVLEKGLRKLRHPERSRHLRPWAYPDSGPVLLHESQPPNAVAETQKPLWLQADESRFFTPKYWDDFAAYWVSTFETKKEKACAVEQLKASRGWRYAYLTEVYYIWLANGRPK